MNFLLKKSLNKIINWSLHPQISLNNNNNNKKLSWNPIFIRSHARVITYKFIFNLFTLNWANSLVCLRNKFLNKRRNSQGSVIPCRGAFLLLFDHYRFCFHDTLLTFSAVITRRLILMFTISRKEGEIECLIMDNGQ